MRRATRLALPLLLAACSTTPDRGNTDAGPDAGQALAATRYIDLRFRGIGEALSAERGLGGGVSPGLGGGTLAGPGSSFTEGVFVSDFFLTWVLTYPDAGTYFTEIAWSGVACDSILSDPLSNGSTVLELGGDPTSSAGSCTMASAGPVDAGVNTAYVSGLSLGSSEIDFLNEHDFTRQFVVTALSEVDAGVYAFVAQAYPARNEQFANVFVLATSDQVPTVADDLSDAGWVITASTAGPSGIALVGTRPLDGGVRRVAMTLRGPIDPGSQVATLIAASYAPMAFLQEQLPDGGFQTTIIGQR